MVFEKTYTPQNVYIIAEVGVNHNGSLELAMQLVDVAADCGVDAVKFQTFSAEAMTCAYSKKAPYQIESTGAEQSQRGMLESLELSDEHYRKLAEHCRAINIDFLSTPFDHGSLRYLSDELDLAQIKISSGDITNAPLLLAAAQTGKPIILSTGMSTLGEVEAALAILSLGYLHPGISPSGDQLFVAYCSRVGQSVLKNKVTLLHCTTAYPTPELDVNLRAMDTLRQAFQLRVGYSDHTAGISIPIAAVARGAVLIEKHITLDRDMPGPDHKASLEPDRFREMVGSIREVELALGIACKQPTQSEMENREIARRSIVAARDIVKGEIIDETCLAAKRPAGGASPFQYWDMLGQPADKDYAKDEKIQP
ncbi:MAG: N-acetylneuraminate synthase [Desulfobulbaceae bacterium]|nr:N-acetylneuraminate synthase [Desulfobulbaceae bacterium]